MPSVLLPKYSLGQISTNFFNKSQKTSMSKFISDNFSSVPQKINRASYSPPIQNETKILISQIIIDYGNGPISLGMKALTLINTNVVTDTLVSHDIFNNVIIYGANIPFKYVTLDEGRNIVLNNLQMVQLLNTVSPILQKSYYLLIDSIVNDLKKGIYQSSNYSTSLLRQSRVIAQSAGILNGYIINNTQPPLSVKNLEAVTVTASPDEGITNDSGVRDGLHEYLPHRTLKNSVASTAPYDNYLNDFEALASDIPDAFGTNEQPKLKFLFTVQFYPRAGLKLPESGDQDMAKMRFALKRATRPQPTITYQDVNFYGLRTKVAIKMDYGTVTLTFYDDVVNRAHNIVSKYLNYVSPISLINKEQAGSLDGANNGAISIGAYADNPLGPFESMRIVHHMLDDKNADTGFAKQVFYDYLNPKIISVNLDDLDMSQSDVSTVEVTFVYDSVNIIYSDVDDDNPTTTDTSSSGVTSPTIVAPIPPQGSSTSVANTEGWNPIGPGSNGTTGGFFGGENG